MINKLNKIIQQKDKFLYKKFIICFIILFRNINNCPNKINNVYLFTDLWLLFNESPIRRYEGVKSIKYKDFDLIFNLKFINNFLSKSNHELITKLKNNNKKIFLLNKKIDSLLNKILIN